MFTMSASRISFGEYSLLATPNQGMDVGYLLSGSLDAGSQGKLDSMLPRETFFADPELSSNSTWCSTRYALSFKTCNNASALLRADCSELV